MPKKLEAQERQKTMPKKQVEQAEVSGTRMQLLIADICIV